jgi:hypothetical protein
MTHDELIARARTYAASFGKRGAFRVPAEVFDVARLVETVLVYLGNKKRDDYVAVYLNRETGEFITASYSPGSTGKSNLLSE